MTDGARRPALVYPRARSLSASFNTVLEGCSRRNRTMSCKHTTPKSSYIVSSEHLLAFCAMLAAGGRYLCAVGNWLNTTPRALRIRPPFSLVLAQCCDNSQLIFRLTGVKHARARLALPWRVACLRCSLAVQPCDALPALWRCLRSIGCQSSDSIVRAGGHRARKGASAKPHRTVQGELSQQLS